MKKVSLLFILLVVIAVIIIGRFAATTENANGAHQFQKVIATDGSDADRQIQRANSYIKALPSRYESYNLLASAYMAKARESGDFTFNDKAEAAINKSLELVADNLDAVNLKAQLLVAYHQFSEALAVARRSQQAHPDRPNSYLALTDALIELGDYKSAIESAQTLMNLRPDSVAYARASHLRALHGDTEGAIEAMAQAIAAANDADAEAVAWYHVQLGNQLMSSGKPTKAEKHFDTALQKFADYHLALTAKAHTRAVAGDYEAAIAYYEKAQRRVPAPTTAIALGDLYTKLGRNEEARRQYEFAAFAEKSNTSPDAVVSQQMVMFFADRNERLDESLAFMQREREMRADIYTADALAWVLFKKGRLKEAKTASAEALRLRSRDARLHYHAGMIDFALGNKRTAAEHLRIALAAKTSFDGNNTAFGVLQMEIAKQTLQRLENKQ